jgi:hypothetical protein
MVAQRRTSNEILVYTLAETLHVRSVYKKFTKIVEEWLVSKLHCNTHLQ